MFILKYLENSDAACTSEVELFATEAEAHSPLSPSDGESRKKSSSKPIGWII